MDSVYYLASLIGVLLLIRWYISADRSGGAAAARGLFGTREKIERPPPFKAKVH